MSQTEKAENHMMSLWWKVKQGQQVNKQDQHPLGDAESSVVATSGPPEGCSKGGKGKGRGRYMVTGEDVTLGGGRTVHTPG